MNDTRLAALLHAASHEPGPPLDLDRIVAAGGRRERRRRTAALIGAPLAVLAVVAAVSPIATQGPVSTPPGYADGAAPGVQVLHGRHELRSANDGTGNARPSAQQAAVELARTTTPEGAELVLAGYRTTDGSLCFGFPDLPGPGQPPSAGLTESCDPKADALGQREIRVVSSTSGAPSTAQTRHVWGSVPGSAVALRVTAGTRSYTLPVTTSDAPGFTDLRYVVAVLPIGADEPNYEAIDADGQTVA